MKKILIVEDDQLVANIYGNRFSREGFEVKIAPDGAAGLALARSFEPDVIMLDLLLPRMTGVELTKRLRTEAKLEQVPIIVFSNAYMTSMMQQALQAGATKCLSKDNCTPRQVSEVVRGLVSGSAEGAPAPGGQTAIKSVGREPE